MSACEKEKGAKKTVQRTRCRAAPPAGLVWVGCVDDCDDDDDDGTGG